jgi:hypothetical protein
MNFPGFTGEASLYRTGGSYRTTGSGAPQSNEVIPSQLPFPGASPLVINCGTCYRDETGACVRDCTSCPQGHLPNGCDQWTEACAPNKCPPCTVTSLDSGVITAFGTSVGDLNVIGAGRTTPRALDKQLSFSIDQAGALVMQFDSNLSSDGAYTATWRYGTMVNGIRDATLVTRDGKHIEGTVNGRALMPFTAASSTVTYADGTPVPPVVFPAGMDTTLRQIPAALKAAMATCRETVRTDPYGRPTVPRGGSGRATKFARRLSGSDPTTFGSSPRIDDTSLAASCGLCIAEAYAAAELCGAACGLSFGVGCACIVGIPLLYANCHSPGEDVGKGCCPVACGPSESILNVGVVFECCFSGDTCLGDAVGSCCGDGLQPCNHSTCCPSNAPCRDVGICCPTNQNTCNTPSGPVCCNQGEDCVQGMCCPRGSPLCSGLCCPGGTCDQTGKCCIDGVCCVAGQVDTLDGCCPGDLLTTDRQHCGVRCGNNICLRTQHCCNGQCCDGECCGASCCPQGQPSCLGEVNGKPICSGVHPLSGKVLG